MGCKSCKKNNRTEEGSNVIKSIIDAKKEINKPTDSVPNSDHKLFNYEKVALTIFGWFPLVVGYYCIVKFIIKLF